MKVRLIITGVSAFVSPSPCNEVLKQTVNDMPPAAATHLLVRQTWVILASPPVVILSLCWLQQA